MNWLVPRTSTVNHLHEVFQRMLLSISTDKEQGTNAIVERDHNAPGGGWYGPEMFFQNEKVSVFLVLQIGKIHVNSGSVPTQKVLLFRYPVLVHDTTGRMLVLDNHMRHFNNKISTMASWAVPPWCICWWIFHLSIGSGFVTADIVPCTNFQRNYSWFPSFQEKQEINSGTCLQYGIPIRRLIY